MIFMLDLFVQIIKDLLAMKPKLLNVESLKLIKDRLSKEETKNRFFSNQSYQEYQFYNTDSIPRQLIENLISLATHNKVNTSILDNIVQNHNKHFSCLLAFCSQIGEVIQESRVFTLSHKNYASQSALLAFFLAKQHSANVSLVVADESLLQMGHLIAGEAEDDKISFTKAALQKEGVSVLSLKEWRREGAAFAADAFVVLDVFGLNPVDYSPFLLRSFGGMAAAKRAFVYHSHLQDDEVAALLFQLSAEALPLRLWAEHPLECVLEREEGRVVEQLIDFLREDANHPQKQDSVVFFPVEQHVRHFSARLAEQLSKAGLKDCVSVIAKPHQPQLRSKNNIFIVQGTEQLQRWNYDYANVLYVIDYGKQVKFTYNYAYDSFVRSIKECSEIQKSKRMALVGVNRIGRYVCLRNKMVRTNSYIDQAKELTIYLLKMIDYGVFHYVNQKHPRIAHSIQTLLSLQIITKTQEGYAITDERTIEAAKHGISAIQSNLIYHIIDSSSYSEDQKKRFANLMIMTLILTSNENNLRQAKQQVQAAAHIKPNGIWRKTGYIDSCLEIITKCELIDLRKNNLNSKSQSFRRKTSKFNEYQYDVYGSLFEIEEKRKKTFEEMEIPDLVREYTVNDDLLNAIREQIDDYRDVFSVQQTGIIFDKHDIVKIVALYLKFNKRATAIYSGSRRNGYYLSNDASAVFPDKTSLICQLNERPQFLAIFRLSQYQTGKEILMGNAYSADTYLQIYEHLPIKKHDSLSEIQVEFHGISSSIFQKLWKSNGAEIIRFQNQNDCFVEPNEEMALIVLHCIKDRSEQIKNKFQAILNKIRQKLSVSNKLVHYLGSTNLILGAGGAVKEIVKADYINKCLLSNLHLNIIKEDLEQLFEQFVNVKDIVVNQPEQGKFYKSAIIHFHSQREYYKFVDIFQECVYYDRMMDIKPLKDEMSNSVKAQQYIQFKWYVWKSHKKALVNFADAQGAKKAHEAFKVNPILDDIKVISILQENSSKLIIDQLNGFTDEIYIEQALKNYGGIKDVEILKTPLKEIAGEDMFLENLIRNLILNNNNLKDHANFKMGGIEKKKNGLRICRVSIPNLNVMNFVANQLNKTIGKLGEGRLYAQTWFQTPTLVPYGSMTIYQQILDETIKAPENINVQSFIKEDRGKTYIILKSRIKQALDIVHQKFANSLLGFPLYLTDYERSIILTDIGLANILDVQEKYGCKLIVNMQAKVLNILTKESKIKEIKEQIKSRVDDSFFYRINLNTKTFKYFQSKPEKLKEIKSNYNLSLIEVQIDTKALLLEGSAFHVQKAFNFLMHFIESLTVPEEQIINTDVCGICCEEPHRPYRLQSCSHKFCRECIIQYVNSALGDATLFPLKCPHCFKLIVIDDLQIILEPAHWVKVQTIATNQYVAQKAEMMTFCFNAGCKQINMIKNESIECDVCLSTFCINCKLRYHPGMTCEQAKSGGDELFKKYMKENGIRQCPNKTCKIPVVRIDGCYRVTCSRCNVSMCFKCEPDQMKAYPDYNQCYAHLNEVHGGYW